MGAHSDKAFARGLRMSCTCDMEKRAAAFLRREGALSRERSCPFAAQMEETMSKMLVAFFSAQGTTAKAARKLAEAIGADSCEIRPATPYSDADLDWHDPASRTSVEMRDTAFRPPLADTDADIKGYDVVFLGFPIWWYIAPTIINTFLESHDFAGKTIVLFATSGGSGFGKTVEGLRASVDPSTRIIEGKLLNGPLDASSLRQWVDSLGL